jgi:hypothetical protein
MTATKRVEARSSSRSKKVAALDAAEAALAAGDRGPAEGDGEAERAQRQRQQREVDALAAQDQEADRQGQHGDEGHAEQHRQQHLPGNQCFCASAAA